MARAMTSGRVARATRPVDVRLVTGLFLVLVTLGGGMLFWQTVDRTEPVLVYARDVPAGATLRSSDLTTVSFAIPHGLQGTIVPATERARVVGKVAAEELHPGGLVQAAQLDGRPAVPSGGGIVSLPVTAASAAGGRIQIGDHVRVIATWNRGRPDARTRTILPDAIVEDVQRAAPTRLGGGSATASGAAAITAVSVIVDDAPQMEQLVAAKEDAALDLVWLAPSGAETVQPTPVATARATPTR